MNASRFWLKVDRGPGCWNWTGARTKRGYGVFNAGQKRAARAHRVAWELTYGSIANGLIVCHHCDNPSCVRPDHLFLGTHKINAEDRDQKGRGYGGDRHYARTTPERLKRGDDHWSRRQPEKTTKGEAHGCARLKSDDVRAIRRDFDAGLTTYEIAESYGIAQSHAHRIVTRQAWRHIE